MRSHWLVSYSLLQLEQFDVVRSYAHSYAVDIPHAGFGDLMGMQRPSEIPSRASSVWPSARRNAAGPAASHGSDRLNTPFRRTLVYLLARTRGGRNRCRILRLLHDNGPLNANQIASSLGLHYTTVKHHLEKLAEDDVIASNPRDDTYGAMFFLTYQMERNATFLDEIFPAPEEPDEVPPRRGFAPKNTGAVSQ
jgi:DNA-binding transcriptional ArsR family regulator